MAKPFAPKLITTRPSPSYQIPDTEPSLLTDLEQARMAVRRTDDDLHHLEGLIQRVVERHEALIQGNRLQQTPDIRREILHLLARLEGLSIQAREAIHSLERIRNHVDETLPPSSSPTVYRSQARIRTV